MPGLAPTRIEPFRIAGWATPGTSPVTFNVQLPAYGTYLVLFLAWYTNSNTLIQVPAIVTYYGLDAAGSQENWIRKTRLIGSAAVSSGASSNSLSSLEVADPTTTGVVVVTVSWTGGDSKTMRVIAKGLPLSTAADFVL